MSEFLTVTRLNQYIKSVIESDFSLMNIALIGEVSTLTKHYTGHFYFTLKDETSQIKCMMFSSYASRVNFPLKNGDQILIKGYVGVYDKGGSYQVYCREITPYGEGQYLLKLALLKEKLQKEGILDKEKLPLPLIPRRIALITAKGGAAIHDFLSTLKKRINTEVYVFPCLVQGGDAPKSIVKAIKSSFEYNPDLIVVARGGGSKEDLIAFNDEDLVRFVSDLKIPLISAVGHQVDTTLIDYVSSLRCITPTDAAMHAVPSKQEVESKINYFNQLIDRYIDRKITSNMEKLLLLSRNIDAYSPINRLKMIYEKINLLLVRIDNNIKLLLNKKINSLNNTTLQFKSCFKSYLQNYNVKLIALEDKIKLLNPRLKIKNGFGFIENQSGQSVTSIKKIKPNDRIAVYLSDGIILAEVKEIKED